MKRELAKIRRLSWHQWGLLGEAGMLLAVAAGAVAFLPFARVSRWASARRPGPAQAPDAAQLRKLRWAVEAVAKRAPFRAKCFERGLAAQWMLGRRGIASTLFYGAALEKGSGLSAHVWVRAGEFDVVGCENHSDFTIVARFPPES